MLHRDEEASVDLLCHLYPVVEIVLGLGYKVNREIALIPSGPDDICLHISTCKFHWLAVVVG